MSDCEHSWLYQPKLGRVDSCHFCYKCQKVRPIIIVTMPQDDRPRKCKGKIIYESFKAAIKAADYIFNREGEVMRAYPHKTHFHLTTQLTGCLGQRKNSRLGRKKRPNELER